MDKQNFNQQLENRFNSKHPTLLFPVRLETRYVHTGTMASPYEHSVNLTLSDLNVNTWSSTQSLSEVFDSGIKMIDRMEAIGREWTSLERTSVNAAAIYKLSLLDSRFGVFADKTLQTLEGANARMRVNQESIAGFFPEEIPLPFSRLQQDSQSFPPLVKKRLEKIVSTILNAVQHPEDVHILSVDALLNRQNNIQDLIAGYYRAIAEPERMDEADAAAVKSQYKRFKPTVTKWNAETTIAITKYESGIELLRQKFVNAIDRLAELQVNSSEDFGFSKLSEVWKNIDRFKMSWESKSPEETNGLFPAAIIEREENLMKILVQSLEQVEIRELDSVVLNDLSDAIALSRHGTDSIAKNLIAQQAKNKAWIALLRFKLAQLEKAVQWENCGENDRIPETVFENIERCKRRITQTLQAIESPEIRDNNQIQRDIQVLIEAADAMIELLGNLGKINCMDCPGLEAMLNEISAVLAQKINLLENWLAEQTQENAKSQEQINQIQSLLNESATKYLPDHYTFFNRLKELDYLLSNLFELQAHTEAGNIWDLSSLINEKLGELLLESAHLESLPVPQTEELALISGTIDAIRKFQFLLNGLQNRLIKQFSEIDLFIKLLNKVLDKKPSNCQSKLASELRPKIKCLLDQLDIAGMPLSCVGETELKRIYEQQARIKQVAEYIVSAVNRQQFIDAADLSELGQLLSELTAGMIAWKGKIAGLEKTETQVFNRWKEILASILRKNGELEQLLLKKGVDPVLYSLLKTHQTLYLFGREPFLYDLDIQSEFSKDLESQIQRYERMLEALHEFPQAYKNRILGELNSTFKTLNASGFLKADGYARAASLLEIQINNLEQFVFPQIEEVGAPESASNLGQAIRDAREAVVMLEMCNSDYACLQKASLVLIERFNRLQPALKNYKPGSSAELAMTRMALGELIAGYRTWQAYREPFVQKAREYSDLIRSSYKNSRESLAGMIRRLSAMPNSAMVQAEKVQKTEGKKAKTLKLPAWNYHITPGDWELWIRVFPDDVAIDFHDAAMTNEEVEAAKHYWRTIWAKPVGSELDSLKMGLWRSMVYSFGEQRAAYAVRTLKPSEMSIENGVFDPQNDLKKKDLPGKKKLLVFPEVEIKEGAWNKAPVSYIMPDSFVFALYEKEDSIPELYFGADTIPDELITGIDPGDSSALTEAPNGELQVGAALKWTVDFSEAVARGMAIRIKLSEPNREFAKIVAIGLKTRSSADTPLIEHSQNLLEKLFNSHHYAPGGMAFIPPGTPTNNTSDTDSGYSPLNDESLSFQTELTGDTFSVSTTSEDRPDAQVFAEALGIDPTIFQHIYQAAGYTCRNAGVMNYCLGQGTLGNFFEEMFQFFQTGDHLFNTLTWDKVDNEDLLKNLDTIRNYMTCYVTGRAAIPSIRVGDQPYGILPAGVFHQSAYQWSADEDSPLLLENRPFFTFENEYNYPTDDAYGGLFKWNDQFDETFCRNLLNILLGLKGKWLEAAGRIQTVDDPLGLDHDDPTEKQRMANERFLHILGLHAHAQSFDNRYSVGAADEALKEKILPGSTVGNQNFLGLKNLFFTRVMGVDIMEWNWGRTIQIDNINTSFNNNETYLKLSHLRHLDFPEDRPNTLQGSTVDELKPSEKRRLSPIAQQSTQNYIDWLQRSSIKTILKANIEGSMPSRSLLYLLLSNSYLNYAWDASMRIYANLMGSGSGTRLKERVFAGLPKKLFPNWNFEGSSWAAVKNYVDNLYPDTEKQKLAVSTLNLITDFKELTGSEPSYYSFKISSNKLIYAHDNGYDNTNTLNGLAYPLSAFAYGTELDRKTYDAFIIDWHPDFLKALKSGVYKVDSFSEQTFFMPLPKELADDLLNESALLKEEFSYYNDGSPYAEYGVVREYPNRLYFLEDPESNIDASGKYLIAPLKYTVRQANNRLYFLLRILSADEAPGIVVNGTSSLDNSMANYLKRPSTLNTHYAPETEAFKKLLEKLPLLSALPTAELERLMSEHLDICSHRLDAWLQSFLNRALSSIRNAENTRTGSYIGAFGYLINLKKGATRTLAADQSEILVDAIGDKPLNLIATDSDNQGYIHAPSINHAITAAIMRAGYMANGGEENSAFEINLQSARVKKALWLLDGIRNGQPLGALLGYQFERALHEAQLDEYVYDLRGIFPLVSNNLIENASNAVETVEANNVLDGLKLLEAGRGEANVPAYATFYSLLGSAHQDTFDILVENLENSLDAVSDLVLSESVFQLTRGNFAKSSAVQQALNSGLHIPELDIVKTPRTGHPVMHRVGILLDENASKMKPAHWPDTLTPRAETEPTLNKWLGEQMGNPAAVKILARYKTTSAPNLLHLKWISLYDLGIQAIDLALILKQGYPTPESELGRLAKHCAVKMILDEGDEPVYESIVLEFEPETTVGELSFGLAYPVLSAPANLFSNDNFLNPEHLAHTATIEASLNKNQSIDISELSVRTNALRDTLSQPSGFLQRLVTAKTDLENDVAGAINTINALFLEAWHWGMPEALSQPSSADTEKSFLMIRATLLIDALTKRLEIFDQLAAAIPPKAEEQEIAAHYISMAKALLGQDFVMAPLFKLLNPEEFRAALTDSQAILPAGKSLVMETWLAQLARIRPKIGHFEHFLVGKDLNDAFEDESLQVAPLQLPYRANDHWVGDELPELYFQQLENDLHSVSRDKLSLVLLLEDARETILSFDGESPSPLYAGLLIDEWMEVIPNKEETTGIAFHYNQPNAEAPQTILLTVPPVSADYSLDYLLDAVNSTFELAKLRAVEPDHLTSAYTLDTDPNSPLFFSHPLPGVMAKVSEMAKEPDISTDFNINNLNKDPNSALFPFGTFNDLILSQEETDLEIGQQ